MITEVLAAGLAFTCTPIAVWDGDGPIWCAEGPRIRLAGIAAREIDNSCRGTQPCPSMDGVAARNVLVKVLGGEKGRLSTGHIKVSGPILRCRSDGSAGGTRTAAWCASASTGDLSCALVALGSALRWQRYWRGHRCS